MTVKNTQTRHGLLLGASIVSAALMAAPVASAQQRGADAATPNAPVAHQNLKVLPSDIPQAQLLQTMQGFAQALGVQCGYCHATAPAPEGGGRGAAGGRGRGPAAPQFDYPSDDKPAKKAAREMMLIVRDLNTRVPAAVGKAADAAARVQCVTCHHGVAIPKQLADILAQTAMEKGTPAAVAQYKELRKQYFGAQAYDFGESTLVTFAQRAAGPEDQTVWLRLNLEYFPFSSRTYAALAQAQQKQNDRDGALKSLTRAVELDPQNAQAKRQLDQMKDAK
jgi:photosynthetic reaction center cytochrome c subunit